MNDAHGSLQGKVAVITGAARGQGRSHAVVLAREGADIVASDICEQLPGISIPMGSRADLDETARQAQAAGGRVVSVQADSRSGAAMSTVVRAAIQAFGRIDILVVSHGVISYGRVWELSDAEWDDVVSTNLKGVWVATKAVIPQMIDAGGGAIVVTSSSAGLMAYPNLAHYVAAKHGVIGLVKALALELAPHQIRVNAVCPGPTDTPLIRNDATYRLFSPTADTATFETMVPAMERLTKLPLTNGLLEPSEISNAVLFLASNASRRLTGVILPVDAGATIL